MMGLPLERKKAYESDRIKRSIVALIASKLLRLKNQDPGANEILLKVRAAGINFAEMELTKGKYQDP